MNDHKIKLIRSILNDFYKDKKMYLKNLKIRYTVIKYKKSNKKEKTIFLILTHNKENFLKITYL